MAEYSVVGKRVNRVDAVSKVTGRAVYAADIVLPNMLYGKVLWSDRPHARIRRLDISKAEKMPGVKAVITADDAPPQKGENEYPDPMTSCITGDKVVFAGQPIAAVAATSLALAEDAVKSIEVDYEDLTPVMDVLEAMKPESQTIHPNTPTLGMPVNGPRPNNTFWYTQNLRGDVDAGFREAEVIVENTYRTQVTHQGFIEPRAATASVDANGKVSLWCDSQGIFECREEVAKFLNLPLNQLKVMPMESGGAFGGKSHQIVSPLAILLSRKAGRPVKIVTDRDEVFQSGRPGAASAIKVKLGAKKDGRLTAADVTFVYDYGASYGMGGMGAVPQGSMTGLNPYRIPNFKIETFSVFTNKFPSGPYRSPTAPQATFAVESQVDTLCRALGMDPLEFRLKNAVSEGDLMISGVPFTRVGLKQALEKMKEYLATKSRPEGPQRGRGVACGFWGGGCGPVGVDLHVNSDGTVELAYGALDVSGTRTTMTQVVAEELGLDFKDVSVVTGDTDTVPFSIMSVGSMITRTLITPVIAACDDIKKQLCERGAEKMKVAVKDVEYSRGRVQIKGNPENSISISEMVRVSHPPKEGPITAHASGKPGASSLVFGVATCDIEIDKETGKAKILSYAAVQDVGKALNPTLIEGQIHGAVAQGIGWSLWENSIFENGVMQNTNLLDYRMPTALDVPAIDVMLVEVPHSSAPYGIRGVGEPPLVPTLGTIANAIFDATGVRINELPMNPERVLNFLQKPPHPS